MQGLILAGGLGTRMRPITEKIPKAMIEVAGYPFAHHQLTLLARQGVRRVVYAIGYRGDMLRDYVGDGARYGLDVQYTDEGEILRGTAGAIRLAVDSGCLDPGFLVIYGDSYLPIAVEPVWRASDDGRRPLMTILRNESQWDRSNVRFGDGQPFLYDKRVANPIQAGMRYIDYGLSVLTRDVILSRVPASIVMDLADVFNGLSREGQLAGYEVTERFYECGSPEGVRDLTTYLMADSHHP
jgi:NDP-sugar pyrophosphorylase family protein